jgi:phage protein D
VSDRSAPTFYVRVKPEGKAAAEPVDLTERVLSFEYEDSEKKADLLKLSINNWDLSGFDDPVWKKGNVLIVSWGYPGDMAPPREVVVQKMTGWTVLQVEAQGRAVLLNKVVRSRSWDGKTRAEVVRLIAKENGYEGARADVEETGVVMETITQGRMTDAQFCKRLADAEGFEFFVDFDGFHWHKRRIAQRPLRVLQWFLPPDVGDIISANVENDIFAKPGAVTTAGRDPLTKKDVKGEASDATVPRDANAPTPEIIDPVTGASTFGSNAASADVRPTSEVSDKQAKKEAAGIYMRTQQTAVKLAIEMVGDPGIVAKSVIDVRGVGKRISGLYYVNQANHRIDSGGYKLSLKTTTDGTHGHREDIAALNVSGAPTSAKKVSDKGAAKADKGALEPVEVIDPASGQSAMSYRDLRGRDAAQSDAQGASTQVKK